LLNAVEGKGHWPEELEDYLIMERWGCGWHELQSLPFNVVEDMRLIMQVEGMARKVNGK